MSKTQPQEVFDKPSARALSFVLRNRELWPEGFRWDYQKCHSCAMGLAAALWTGAKSREERACAGFHMIENLVAEAESAERIFYYIHRSLGISHRSDVTPEHVADAIDAYLAGAA